MAENKYIDLNGLKVLISNFKEVTEKKTYNPRTMRRIEEEEIDALFIAPVKE